MALNRNHHPNGGVLIQAGESILRECKNVELSFGDITPKNDIFKGTKKGSAFLTQYRMVFLSSHMKEKFCSFMFPYYLMKNCSIEQPVFAANFIQGLIKAEAGGGWEGQANFKMSFPSGGAIELGQHLFKLASNASRAPASHNSNGLAQGTNGYASPAMPQPYPYPSMPQPYPYPGMQQPYPYPGMQQPYQYPGMQQAGFNGPVGVHPSAPMYMPPPPPYPGPPQEWCAPPVAPVNGKAAEAASSAFYNPSNPHSVYMPTDQPPPYYPPENPDKKNN